jgi:arylsulfatase A-like enzyme
MPTLTRRSFAAGGLALAAPRTRPNVVLLMTDQQSISALSAAGSPYLRTPHFDRLAAQGTRFTNSWCASPVCSPSRSAIVSGCYPTRTGVLYNGDPFKPEVPCVGEIFEAAGYETAWAGKWHLPGPFPGAYTDSPKPHRARGFEFLPFKMQRQSEVAFGDFTDDPIARAAADFLRRPHSKPFLLAVSIHNPHDICYWVMDKLPPNHPARAEFGVASDKLPPLPGNHLPGPQEPEFIGMCRRRDHYGEENTYTPKWDELRWRRYLYGYYRMTERADASLGLVLEALRSQGLDDNTIVILTSDHGEGMAAHRWVVKLMLWQEVVSVPMIWRWPGKIPADRVDKRSLVSGIDIVPTLCDLAEVQPPQVQHGDSLTPALRGGRTLKRESLFAQLAPDTKDHSLQGRAIRTERYKYIRFSTGDNPELFHDLEADPGETRNLVKDPSQATRLRKHRQMLDHWTKKTEA